jgi:hypothetical protein
MTSPLSAMFKAGFVDSPIVGILVATEMNSSLTLGGVDE